MELGTARTNALQLMRRHGLTQRGWRFEFDRAEKRLGRCVDATKTISIGAAFVRAADVDAVEQTMLHEIAHALVDPNAGHGHLWVSKARDIGYTGNRTGENPSVKAQQAADVAHARAIEARMSAVTSGPLRVGERVVRVDGRYSGLVVSIARTRCRVLNDGDGKTWLLQIAELRRANTGGQPAGLTDEPRFRIGDRVRTADGAHSGPLSKVGRTRYHFTSEQDGIVYTTPFSNARLLEPAPARVEAAVSFVVNDRVVTHKANSKYDGLHGVVQSVGPKNYRVLLDDGSVLLCSRGLVRAE